MSKISHSPISLYTLSVFFADLDNLSFIYLMRGVQWWANLVFMCLGNLVSKGLDCPGGFLVRSRRELWKPAAELDTRVCV